MGKLREFRRGDQEVLRDLAHGWEWYWEHFALQDAGYFDPARDTIALF